jgi:hypothetical protein
MRRHPYGYGEFPAGHFLALRLLVACTPACRFYPSREPSDSKKPFVFKRPGNHLRFSRSLAPFVYRTPNTRIFRIPAEIAHWVDIICWGFRIKPTPMNWGHGGPPSLHQLRFFKASLVNVCSFVGRGMRRVLYFNYFIVETGRALSLPNTTANPNPNTK